MPPKSNSSDKLATLIKRWREPGSAGFFNFLADVKPVVPSSKGGYEPYIPGPREHSEIAAALDGEHRTIVFCWPRRHGKTVASAMIIVWRFLSRQTQTIAIVANSEKQSVDMAFKLVRDVIQNTVFIKRLIDTRAIEVGADWIEYEALGNRIQGYSNKPQSLYGRKISVAQVSELHAATSDDTYQVLASSTIDTDDGLVLIDSTVGSRSSPLYTLYDVAQRGADPTLYFSYIAYKDIDDAVANGPAWIAEAALRSRAATMLPAMFAQQHLNQWSSGSNALFSEDQLTRATADAYALDVAAIANGRAWVTGGGLDRAYGFSVHGDSTVTTAVLKVLDGDDPHFFVMASDAVMFSTESGIKRNLSRYHKEYGMSKAVLEAYNAQDIGAWASEQPFSHEIAHASDKAQANIFNALYQLMAEGRLHIHPSFKKLIEELRVFEYSLEGSTPKFGAPKKLHDDHVYSLAWSIYALRDVELNPYEMKGIVCNGSGPSVRLCVLNGGDHVPMCASECRSMYQADGLYRSYLTRAGIAPMKFPDFYKAKIINTGAHIVPR